MSAPEISAEATRALSPVSESSQGIEMRPQESSSPISPTTADNSSATTDEAWQLVTKIFRPRPTQTREQPQTQALPIANRYQVLTPREITAPQPTPAVNTAGNTPPSATAPRASAPRPRESVGEIVVEQPIDVTALMSALRPHLTMPLRGIPSQDFVTLKPGCVKDHGKIVSELTRMQAFSQHAQFFFRRATEERRHRLVIRGLHDNEDLSAIKSDLSSQGVTVHHVSEMKRACYSETGAKSFISLGLYVIEINHREIPLTKAVTTILNQIIRWEEYRGRDRVPHCKRCQLWGHSHNGCRRNAVCLYCAGAHSIENCNRPENPRCANCGSNHVASFHECPALLSYKEARARQLGGARQTRAAAQLATRLNSLAPSRVAAVGQPVGRSPDVRSEVQFPTLTGLAADTPTTAGTGFADAVAGRPITAQAPSTPLSLAGLGELGELLHLLQGVDLRALFTLVKDAIAILKGPGNLLSKAIAIIPLLSTAFP